MSLEFVLQAESIAQEPQNSQNTVEMVIDYGRTADCLDLASSVNRIVIKNSALKMPSQLYQEPKQF